ncbi:hypothetical protein FACS18949_16550 [Clostridia bacterium]|nr:hypothetical protein FACS18949_16550 [Clostridia bacterium]
MYMITNLGRVTTRMTEVDIHGMARADAKRFLERTLASLPPSEQELRVIHGYSGGNVLQTLVRKGLSSKRIKQRVIGLNPGVTSLMLGGNL